ncbi:unnamed protein product, partial [Rotaria socialis]
MNKELLCCDINTIRNYRIPCDELCAEIKTNRIAISSNPLVVQSIVEESKLPTDIDKSSLNNRMNRKSSSGEKPTTNNRNVSESQLSNKAILIPTIQQAKITSDQKIQLSQQMLDVTKRPSKHTDLAYQKYESQRSLLTVNIKRKFIWNREQNEKLINNERESK